MLHTFSDWIQFYENDNTNWGDVANAVKNNESFRTKEKSDVKKNLELLGLENDIDSVWSGYIKHENQIFKRKDKVTKSISIPQELVNKVTDYQKENDLGSFSYAVFNLLSERLNHD
jgi:hypothetical protein